MRSMPLGSASGATLAHSSRLRSRKSWASRNANASAAARAAAERRRQRPLEVVRHQPVMGELGRDPGALARIPERTPVEGHRVGSVQVRALIGQQLFVDHLMHQGVAEAIAGHLLGRGGNEQVMLDRLAQRLRQDRLGQLPPPRPASSGRPARRRPRRCAAGAGPRRRGGERDRRSCRAGCATAPAHPHRRPSAPRRRTGCRPSATARSRRARDAAPRPVIPASWSASSSALNAPSSMSSTPSRRSSSASNGRSG